MCPHGPVICPRSLTIPRELHVARQRSSAVEVSLVIGSSPSSSVAVSPDSSISSSNASRIFHASALLVILPYSSRETAHARKGNSSAREDRSPERTRSTALTFFLAVDPSPEPVLSAEHDARGESVPFFTPPLTTGPSARDVVPCGPDGVVEHERLVDRVREKGRMLGREQGRDSSE